MVILLFNLFKNGTAEKVHIESVYVCVFSLNNLAESYQDLVNHIYKILYLDKNHFH